LMRCLSFVGLWFWALWGLTVFHAMPDMMCSKEPLVGFTGFCLTP
jgi:hypothetical protein